MLDKEHRLMLKSLPLSVTTSKLEEVLGKYDLIEVKKVDYRREKVMIIRETNLST